MQEFYNILQIIMQNFRYFIVYSLAILKVKYVKYMLILVLDVINIFEKVYSS